MSTISTDTSLNVKQVEIQNRTNELKQSFNYWRNIFLLIDNLLEWKRSYDPLIIFGSLTFIYTLIYVFDPPALVVLSGIGLIFGLMYTLGPWGIDSLKQNNDWTLVNDDQYSQICERIAYFEQFVKNKCRSMRNIHDEQSLTYQITVGFVLVALVFCVQWIDNLFLIYLTVLILCLIPGLYNQPLLRRYIFSYVSNSKQD